MFGRTVADAVLHPYRDLVKPGVRFVQATIESIDPGARRVETDAGAFDADVMVVALGADLHPSATPGWSRAATSSTPCPGRSPCATSSTPSRAVDVMVGVTSTPFKCPPAPSETALLLHDFLTRAGSSRPVGISLVMPLPGPSRLRRPLRTPSSPRSPSAGSVGTPSASSARSIRLATWPSSRTAGAGLRPLPRGAGPRASPRSSPRRACASTAGSPSTRSR